jgi:uncharacterized membrane protein (GlpM family)
MAVWMLLAFKCLAGGIMVCLFSLVAEVVKPKKFAGIFAAAPAVALASLLVIAYTKGLEAVSASATGMLYGALGMLLYCAAASFLVRRFRALPGSLAAMPVWFGAAFGLLVLFR